MASSLCCVSAPTARRRAAGTFGDPARDPGPAQPAAGQDSRVKVVFAGFAENAALAGSVSESRDFDMILPWSAYILEKSNYFPTYICRRVCVCVCARV